MPALPTFSAYHDALMAKLDELNTSIQGITTTVQANTTAVQAVQGQVAALQGTPGKTMQDIYDKIDSSTADLTQVEASLNNIDNLFGILTSSTDNPAYAQINDLADLLKILMNPAEHTDYFNLHELRIAITGQTFVDAVETESYAPTLEGIIKKLTNLQGTPTSSRQGLVDNRTDLRNILDALASPPSIGTEDPVEWWDTLADILDAGADAADIVDFILSLLRTAGDAAQVGTTGATAIGQWVTALALAVIAMQNNNAQLTRTDIRNNTDDMSMYLDALTARYGGVDPDRVGLYDVRVDIGTAVAFLSNIRSWIEYMYPAIACICEWLKKIENNTSEVVFGLDGGITRPPALATTAPVSEHCQRSFWFMDQMIAVIKIFEAMDRAVTEEMVRRAFLKNFYDSEKGFNVPISDQYARSIARYCKFVKSTNDGADFAGIISVLEIDTATRNALQNSIFSAASASAAQSAWESTALNTIGDTGSGYSYLNTEEKRLIAALVFPELLNALFNGEIPRDPTELSGYSTDCSGLGGSGSVSIPPGGWNYSLYYRRPVADEDINPADDRIVAFYGSRHDKDETIFSDFWSMSDRWTITTNLRGWRFYGQIKADKQTRYSVECYDAGVLIATSGPTGSQTEITVDTSSVQFLIVDATALNGSVGIFTPTEISGWPFAGS
ncbi:MAG: hypothetical protein GF393_12750 [Armatimonadia bacterium]|nr:hypothetical protein [Armatimonadia bacterium]